MTTKYVSPITKTLTLNNWREKIHLDDLSVPEMIDLMADCRKIQKLGKAVDGYMKEAIRARLPEGETEAHSDFFEIEIEFCERAGGLDKDRILEEMGEEWVAEHSKDPTEFEKVTIRELDHE